MEKYRLIFGGGVEENNPGKKENKTRRSCDRSAGKGEIGMKEGRKS